MLFKLFGSKIKELIIAYRLGKVLSEGLIFLSENLLLPDYWLFLAH